MGRIVGILLLSLLVGACGGTASTGTVEGVARAGPQCPVDTVPPDPACGPKPVAIDLVLTGASGDQAASTRSAGDGRFTLSAAPGTYTLAGRSSGTPPTVVPQTVTIRRDATTTVAVDVDTGIR